MTLIIKEVRSLVAVICDNCGLSFTVYVNTGAPYYIEPADTTSQVNISVTCPNCHTVNR